MSGGSHARPEGHHRKGGEKLHSLASEKEAHSGCASTALLGRCSSSCCCCYCCHKPLKDSSCRSRRDDAAAMAHSAPPLPVLAIVGHEPLDQSNGHMSHPSLKSNLKHKSSLPPSLQGRDGSKSNRVRVRVSMPVRPEAAKAKGEEEGGPDSGAGDEAAVANHRQKKRERKVQWIDDYGKDLTQILEFEPRYLPMHTLFSFFLLQ